MNLLNVYFIKRNGEQILKLQEKGGKEGRKERRMKKEMHFEGNANFESPSG
jgi:hypothetical protein